MLNPLNYARFIKSAWLLGPKGKPSGTASASAFFHLRCIFKFRIVAQWSLLTVRVDKNGSMN
jgi:hypothetical protein